MKQQIVRLTDQYAQDKAYQALAQVDLDGSRELVIRDASVGRSLAQLGALFGLWMRELSEQTGYTVAELHAMSKDMFLVDIYLREPMSDIQQMWADNYERFRDEEPERAETYRKMISISDAWKITHNQMSEYLNLVFYHFTSKGWSLSVPDKYHKVFKQANV